MYVDWMMHGQVGFYKSTSDVDDNQMFFLRYPKV